MISSIEFPNTVEDEQKTYFSVDAKHNAIDEIRPIQKNGEMSFITWFQIIKEGKVIAEIKESICNVYYKDKVADETTETPF